MSKGDTWGLATTIKADTDQILAFAAYHIELGAHRLYIYLDEPNPEAFARLKAHPKVRVFDCDTDWWKKRQGKRPVKHQVRQSLNANHAYSRRAEVDWLIHMDVDEFLWPDSPLPAQLAALPRDAMTARVRPVEALADGDGLAYKGYIPADEKRDRVVERLYPLFGRYVKGGFLSHLAGKTFVRTGQDKVEIRIHNAFFDGTANPGESELKAALCHRHAHGWDQWLTNFRYRLEKGSYRADLPSSRPNEHGMTLHQVLSLIEEEEGEPGLRSFFEEICADTPELRRKLKAEGLLRLCDLNLDGHRLRHFP